MSEDNLLTYDACSTWLTRTDVGPEFDVFIQQSDTLSFEDGIDLTILCPMLWKTFLASPPDQSDFDCFYVRLGVLAFLQHHDIHIPPEYRRCFIPVYKNGREEYEEMVEHGVMPAPPAIELRFKGERRGFYDVDWKDKYMEDWYAAYMRTLQGCTYTDDDTTQLLTQGIHEVEEIEVYDCIGEGYFFGWLTTYQYDVCVEVFDKLPWLYFRDHETQYLQSIYLSTFLSRLSRPK